MAGWLEADEPLLGFEGPSLLPPWELPEDLLTIYFDDEEEAQPIRTLENAPAWTQENVIRLQNSYASAVTFWDHSLRR